MRVYLETFGCTMNKGDSEVMIAALRDHEIVGSIEEAEVAVINSCGVVEQTARKVLRRGKGGTYLVRSDSYRPVVLKRGRLGEV